MLTRNLIQASSGASEKVRYYTEDEAVVEYYQPGQEQSIGGDAIWLGSLASDLGLDGPVLKDDLTAMMFGHSPDGVAIRKEKKRNDQEQRLLVDCCLSPPKSWSIAALVCGEDLLIQLHKEAVAEIAQLIEDRHAAARIQIDGQRVSIKTKSLAIAALTHYTARPVKELDDALKVDPQLHTHMLVMNATRGPDGEYRALHTEGLCSAIGIDNIYKNKLAQKAVEHGFAIRNTPDGFELAAISDELVETYSSRTNLAKALCKQQGVAATPDNIKAMSMRSRLAKKLPKTLDQMRIEWAEEGRELGLAGIPRDENAAIQGKSAREMLDSAIRHYSEQSTSFNRDDIELYVFQNPQVFDEQALQYEIFCHPDLIPIGERFTTHTALRLEKEILTQWFTGQQQSEAFAQGIVLEHDLNDSQRAVVLETLKSKDRDQIWQGISGAGKTRSLGALKQELDLYQVKIRGFAPGIQESKELAKELGIDTNTVASLILQEKGFGQNELWIIDEAGKLSTLQLKAIQDKAEQNGARLLLVGDKKQNAAIEAGAPFRQLQRYGATTHKLDKILRQQDKIQKAAVELIAKGEALESFELLLEHGYVNEIPDPSQKIKQIANDFLQLSPRQREKTLIVCGTNQEAHAITTQIRHGLRAEGLIGEDVDARQIVSRQLSTEQKRQLQHYQIGDFLRIHRSNPNSRLKVGELYKITAVHDHDLSLINVNGKRYRFNPTHNKNVEVYTTQALKIAQGDRLRWTHSSRKQGRINGATMDVVSIEGAIATVRSISGKISTVDLSKPVDLGHALIRTSYKVQGQTADRVLISATADPTSKREPFYVAISRQRRDLKIYTQDIDKLKRFIPQTNTQENALELINEQRRIEAKRYRRAIKSAGRDRHQHPYIYSAIASLVTRAIRRNADERLVRQQLERLNSGIERANRGIRQLNRFIAGSNRPTDQQKLIYIEQFQLIEAEFNQFLIDFDKNLIDQLAVNHSDFEADQAQVPTLPVLKTPELSIIQAQWQETIFSDPDDSDLSRKKTEHDLSQQTEIIEIDSRHYLEPEINLNSISSSQANSVNLTEHINHDFDPNQRFQRTTLDGNRKFEATHSATESVDQTERNRHSEPINQSRPESLHGESLDQGETSKIQHWRDAHQPQTVDRAGHHRSSPESGSYPRKWDRDYGQPAIPQSDSATNWDGALAEYRVLKEIASPLNDVIDALRALQDAKQQLELARLLRVVPKPKLIPIFWKPEYQDRDRPASIEPHHWEEFKQSAIHPDLIKLNLESMLGTRITVRLLEDKFDQMGSGQIPTAKMLRILNGSVQVKYCDLDTKETKKAWVPSPQFSYEQLAQVGGWWGKAGVNPQNDWQQSRWGCFKSDIPRLSKKDEEEIKYEHPLGAERQFYLANVPDWLATKILNKHGVDFRPGDNFWKIVHENNLPITYIEGYKKALSALGQGEIAIGVSGANALYQANETINGQKFKLIERRLTPPAQFWATPGRKIKFAYDQDTKLSAILNVRRDLVRAVELHPQNECSVCHWDATKAKGVDDLIVNLGPRAFARAMDNPAKADREIKAHYRYEYNRLKKQGLNDAQIWLKVYRENDYRDGDRVLNQSDFVRANPSKKDEYIKQQKIKAIQLEQQNRNRTIYRKPGTRI